MKIYLYYMILSGLFFVASCGPKKNMVYMEKESYEAEVQQAIYAGNRIQTGDLLGIQVNALDELAVSPFNRSTMSASGSEGSAAGAKPADGDGYLVDQDGNINFPVLGRIPVVNQTRTQLEENIEQRLQRYLTDPMVTVRQLNFNITVLGEVRTPGQFQVKNEKINLFQALGLAGDMTLNGDRTNVRLVRQENGIDKTYILNFNEASITRSPYYYLQQNDILYILPDDKKQIEANRNPNLAVITTVLGIAVALVTLITRF